jgi:hypothetical protein
VKIVYDCKHDDQRRSRCVASGDLTRNVDPESIYSSVVSIKSLCTVMFIGELTCVLVILVLHTFYPKPVRKLLLLLDLILENLLNIP